jgi:hypothetical protein
MSVTQPVSITESYIEDICAQPKTAKAMTSNSEVMTDRRFILISSIFQDDVIDVSAAAFAPPVTAP